MKGRQWHEGRMFLSGLFHVRPRIFCQMDGQTFHEPCWRSGASTHGLSMKERMDELMAGHAAEQCEIVERATPKSGIARPSVVCRFGRSSLCTQPSRRGEHSRQTIIFQRELPNLGVSAVRSGSPDTDFLPSNTSTVAPASAASIP